MDHSDFLQEHLQVQIYQSSTDFYELDFNANEYDGDKVHGKDDRLNPEMSPTRHPPNREDRPSNDPQSRSNDNDNNSQPLSKSISSSFSIYPLSPSYYLLHIHSLPTGSYNIRVYYQDIYMMSFPAVIQTKIKSIRFATTTPMLYINEESVVLLEMIDSFGNMIKHIPLTDIQAFIHNEHHSPAIIKQITNKGIVIRFTPSACSVNSSFLSVCVNEGIDCFTEQIVVGMKSLSGV